MRAMPMDKPPKKSVVNSTYPRKDFIPYKPKEMKILTPHVLDVVEQLKKDPTHVSLWDLLSILEKKKKLREALSHGRKDASVITPQSL